MAWEEVAEGPSWSLFGLSQYENELEESSYNWLQLNLRLPVTQGVAQEVENLLRDAGVEGVKVSTASPVLNIYFKKNPPWLAIIAAIALASIVLAALIVGWKLFTYVGEIAPNVVPLLAIAGIGVLTLIGVAIIRR